MKLIDADSLIKNLDDAIQDAKRNGEICDYWEDDRSNLLYYLDTAPTVDAVEVVRCKDCKHWGDTICNWFEEERIMWQNDFCSYGERGTNETNK